MQKLFKICGLLLAIGAIAYFGSPYIPLSVAVKNLTPTHSFGESMQLSVTMTNYTPVSRDVYFNQGDGPETVTLYIDSQVRPTPTITTKEDALTTMTIAHFGHHTITRTFALRPSSSAASGPQTISGDAGMLTLTPGSHRYYVSWGGYLSGEQTLNVQ